MSMDYFFKVHVNTVQKYVLQSNLYNLSTNTVVGLNIYLRSLMNKQHHEAQGRHHKSGQALSMACAGVGSWKRQIKSLQTPHMLDTNCFDLYVSVSTMEHSQSAQIDTMNICTFTHVILFCNNVGYIDVS